MADQKDFVVRSGITVPNNSTFGANVAISNRMTSNVVVANTGTITTLGSNVGSMNTLTVLVSANITTLNANAVNSNTANVVTLSSNAVTINVATVTTGNVNALTANTANVKALTVTGNSTMNVVTMQDLTVNGNTNITLARGQILRGYREYVTVATGVTGAYTIDLLDSNVFNLTLSANTTLSVANTPNTGISAAYTLIAKQPAGGGARLTWPGGTVWSEGIAPTQSLGANQVDVFTFMSYDGGVMWIGAHSFANVS